MRKFVRKVAAGGTKWQSLSMFSCHISSNLPQQTGEMKILLSNSLPNLHKRFKISAIQGKIFYIAH